MASSGNQKLDQLADEGEGFVALLLEHQRAMYAFLLAMLPFEPDIDDIFQDACLALWRQRTSYDPARPFLPWANRFLEITALKALRTKARDRRQVHLSEALLTRIARSRQGGEATAEARQAALDHCVEKLRPVQRELLRQRYAGAEPLRDIAAAAGVSAASLTMKLQRIRHALRRCVEQAIGIGEVR